MTMEMCLACSTTAMWFSLQVYANHPCSDCEQNWKPLAVDWSFELPYQKSRDTKKYLLTPTTRRLLGNFPINQTWIRNCAYIKLYLDFGLCCLKRTWQRLSDGRISTLCFGSPRSASAALLCCPGVSCAGSASGIVPDLRVIGEPGGAFISDVHHVPTNVTRSSLKPLWSALKWTIPTHPVIITANSGTTRKIRTSNGQ